MQSQAAKAVEVMSVLYQAIVAAGAEGIPSGHLYAMSMTAFSGVDAYESCIGLLLRSGLVKRTGHLLTAELLASKPA